MLLIQAHTSSLTQIGTQKYPHISTGTPLCAVKKVDKLPNLYAGLHCPWKKTKTRQMKTMAGVVYSTEYAALSTVIQSSIEKMGLERKLI